MAAVAPAAKVPATPATVNCVTLSALPSGSLSLASTLPVAALSSATDLVSATTVGASFAPVTVTSMVFDAVLSALCTTSVSCTVCPVASACVAARVLSSV